MSVENKESHTFASGVGLEQISLEHMFAWGRVTIPEGIPIVLPFSGGLDSATIAAFLTRVCGAENILAIHVAHSTTQPQETENAKAVSELLGIQFFELDLHEVNEALDRVIVRETNNFSRATQRSETTSNASVVYAVAREIARRLNGRVPGTLDASEVLTGYFPKETFCGDFAPLAALFRGEVRALSESLGLPPLPEQFAVVPGCGSIVDYVCSQTGEEFASEDELDAELLRILERREKRRPLGDFIRSVSHKANTALAGRPVYFPSYKRRMIVGEDWRSLEHSQFLPEFTLRDLETIDC